MFPKRSTCTAGSGNVQWQDCCQGMHSGLGSIDAALGAGNYTGRKIVHGLFTCPQCPNRKVRATGWGGQPVPPPAGGYECAHWDRRWRLQDVTPSTHHCTSSTIARATGFVYLDVQQLTEAVPTGIVGSPCGNSHHFGVLADAQARAPRCPPSCPPRTSLTPCDRSPP
jgi:hypothetical protein